MHRDYAQRCGSSSWPDSVVSHFTWLANAPAFDRPGRI